MTRLGGAQVLVTGANGFVGKHVCERLLAERARVRGVVRHAARLDEDFPGDVELVRGDVVDVEDMTRAAEGSSVIVHCAASSSDDLAEARRVNRDGTKAVVEAAIKVNAERLIHVSTAAVYDRVPGGASEFTENSPTRRRGGAYVVTKAEAEDCITSIRYRSLSAVILRPPPILGSGHSSPWGTKVPAQIRDGLWPSDRSGDGTMPWVAVADLADAVALLTVRHGGGTYNVVGGHTTWRRYVREVCSWFDLPVPRSAAPAWNGRISARKIQREVGWQPRTTFDEAMSQIHDWWRATGSL